MDEAGKYILSIGAAALISGILNGMTDPKSTSGLLTKMASGLFLMIVMLRPVADLELDDLTGFADLYTQSAAASADYGEKLSADALRQCITDRTEAYILDKACSYGAQLQVAVTVANGEVPVPEAVVIKGNVSPYAKSRLQQIMISDLGIPKENQTWTQ